MSAKHPEKSSSEFSDEEIDGADDEEETIPELVEAEETALTTSTDAASTEATGDNEPEGVIAKDTVCDTEFMCGCCFELLVQPTTLTCGHSFCRLCIANWYSSSKKMDCPTCRSPWQGNPQVNITLRSLIQKYHSETLEERIKDTMNEDSKAKIQEFDESLKKKSQDAKGVAQGQGFCSGVCVAVAIIFIVYLSWYWRSTDKELLVHKPLSHWNEEDVSNWFTSLGPWAEDYASVIQEKRLVGNLLKAVDEENIDKIFNLTDPLHRKALLKALTAIREQGVKQPSNLWEYKALHPGWALLLMYGLKDFPRTVLLYLYMFEYEEMFLPFLHVVSPLEDQDPDQPLPNPTIAQWSEFLPKAVLLPYWLIGEFAWEWLDVHFWTALFILTNCIACSLLETNTVVSHFRQDPIWGSLYGEIKKVFKGYLSMALFILVWPVVPAFVCDCIFYIAMYFSPYQALDQLYHSWVR